MAVNHTYMEDSSNGLHIITTTPRYIKLRNLRNEAQGSRALRETSYYGINGAWFNASTDLALLNIAMQDGLPVGPNGEGTVNEVGTGAFAWNGSDLIHYNDVTSKNDISFSGEPGTWVQGGAAMWLGYSGWYEKMNAQVPQYMTGSDRRSALVANVLTKMVYLVITEGNVTVAAFRSAIQDHFGITDGIAPHSYFKAIMLDGGRSSQMRAMQTNGGTISLPLSGAPALTNRDLTQIITVLST